MFGKPDNSAGQGEVDHSIFEHDSHGVDALTLLVESFARRTPEAIEAAQVRAIASLHPALPPEPGTTAMEHVYGRWPGEETDQQVEQILENLS